MPPEKNQIHFRLVGRDKDWITSKGDNRAFYTNLAPGDYRFEVMATNNDGIWCKEPATFSFTVKAFFYQTLWFKILAAGLALALIWLIVAWRTRAARMKNTWLEKEVAQRTAELNNSLEQLKSTQKQLVQQEKLASLGQLTAGIAHEIQNPLNFVNNFSEVSIELVDEMNEELAAGSLQSAVEIANDIKQNMEKINHHGQRAATIVKSMLQHSRSSSGKMTPTDLNALIREYVNLSYHGMRAGKEPIIVSIELDLEENICQVPLIAEDFSRVIVNICNNAFDAMRSVETQHAASLIVRTKKHNDSIIIEIEDNGPGIAEEIKDKILQPFFTTKKGTEGTGLGLSITNDIVKAHGGELKLETKEGEGTIFIIQLPLTS